MRKFIFVLVLLTACTNLQECNEYSVESCPNSCVVCPPCFECSSISCQTEAFCNNIGFDRDWYDSVRPIKCVERADVCPDIYQPVCANVNVQCITTPCNPVQETFSNSCQACQNSLVDFYRMGECQ
jgi:hypothetical protein